MGQPTTHHKRNDEIVTELQISSITDFYRILYDIVSKSFQTELIMKCTLTFGITH